MRRNNTKTEFSEAIDFNLIQRSWVKESPPYSSCIFSGLAQWKVYDRIYKSNFLLSVKHSLFLYLVLNYMMKKTELTMSSIESICCSCSMKSWRNLDFIVFFPSFSCSNWLTDWMAFEWCGEERKTFVQCLPVSHQKIRQKWQLFSPVTDFVTCCCTRFHCPHSRLLVRLSLFFPWPRLVQAAGPSFHVKS